MAICFGEMVETCAHVGASIASYETCLSDSVTSTMVWLMRKIPMSSGRSRRDGLMMASRLTQNMAKKNQTPIHRTVRGSAMAIAIQTKKMRSMRKTNRFLQNSPSNARAAE
jgi:hypothetical protein